MLESVEIGSDHEAFLPIDSYFGNTGRAVRDPFVEEDVALPGDQGAR